MNIKAERIEQMVQVVNRNLMLVCSGQKDGIAPIEYRHIRKVDANIFGHDKFAFEMVHFVKSFKNGFQQPTDSYTYSWEKQFVDGLETLLVECALVVDEIERDCFVSRVYCWFTEKLVERRDLPRIRPGGGSYEDLKASVIAIGGRHTAKGLDLYAQKSNDQQSNIMGSPGAAKLLAEEMPKEVRTPREKDFPPAGDNQEKFGSRAVPLYVKHGFPEVLRSKNDYTSFLPKIPGANENYGMIYNKPESEAEKNMHDLWIARRRQEAFEWKTRQHISLVMDRLSLHKSRLESDTLRRQESSIGSESWRPGSAGQAPVNSNCRFAPMPRRPHSDHRSRRSRSRGGGGGEESPAQSDDDSSAMSSPERSPGPGGYSMAMPLGRRGLGDGGDAMDRGNDVTVTMTGQGNESSSVIPRASRVTVNKSKKEYVPMRFKNSLPNVSSHNLTPAAEAQQYYMQLSDSDDDDKPDRPSLAVTSHGRTAAGSKSAAKPSAGAKPSGNRTVVMFKRDKPIIRERPASAREFRKVAMNDAELKVHYRHTNYRRMPLTLEQEQWIAEREEERVKKSEDVAKALLEEAVLRAEKKKSKDKDKGKDKDKDKNKDKDKKSKDKDKKATATQAALDASLNKTVKPKYKSATQFMAKHFPNFDDDMEEDCNEALGPMRTYQLIEVARVMGACAEFDVPIKESNVRKALLIPQDRPEAIALENLRDNAEGLMVNPNPVEYWRKLKAAKKKKGGGKKKKSKK